MTEERNVLTMTDKELNDLSAEVMGFKFSDYLPERMHQDWNPVGDIRDAMTFQAFIHRHELSGYFIERLKETFPNKNQVGFPALMNASSKQRTQAGIMAARDLVIRR
jgi:hypothetical protein